MEFSFYKYQGTGNDFILVDHREKLPLDWSVEQVAKCCDRKFGIGADGFILIQTVEGGDFEMVYYNADGRLGSLCGNGSRCAVAFAHFLGMFEGETVRFLAADGWHHAHYKGDAQIEIEMQDVDYPELDSQHFLDTGSPHYIQFVEKVQAVDVVTAGRAIRYNETYQALGTNVNFVEILAPSSLQVATYERGVEDETLSCGTGVTAAALAYHLQQDAPTTAAQEIRVQTKGGQLKVRYLPTSKGFQQIWLCGPAQQVFQGRISL